MFDLIPIITNVSPMAAIIAKSIERRNFTCSLRDSTLKTMYKIY